MPLPCTAFFYLQRREHLKRPMTHSEVSHRRRRGQRLLRTNQGYGRTRSRLPARHVGGALRHCRADFVTRARAVYATFEVLDVGSDLHFHTRRHVEEVNHIIDKFSYAERFRNVRLRIHPTIVEQIVDQPTEAEHPCLETLKILSRLTAQGRIRILSDSTL